MTHHTPVKNIYSTLYYDLKHTSNNETTRVLLWRIRRIIDNIDDRVDRVGRNLSDEEIRRIIKLHIKQLKECLGMFNDKESKNVGHSLKRQLAYLGTFFSHEDDSYAHAIITDAFKNMDLTLDEFEYPYTLMVALWATSGKLSPEAVVSYIKSYYKYCVLPRKG